MKFLEISRRSEMRPFRMPVSASCPPSSGKGLAKNHDWVESASGWEPATGSLGCLGSLERLAGRTDATLPVARGREALSQTRCLTLNGKLRLLQGDLFCAAGTELQVEALAKTSRWHGQSAGGQDVPPQGDNLAHVIEPPKLQRLRKSSAVPPLECPGGDQEWEAGEGGAGQEEEAKIDRCTWLAAAAAAHVRAQVLMSLMTDIKTMRWRLCLGSANSVEKMCRALGFEDRLGNLAPWAMLWSDFFWASRRRQWFMGQSWMKNNFESRCWRIRHVACSLLMVVSSVESRVLCIWAQKGAVLERVYLIYLRMCKVALQMSTLFKFQLFKTPSTFHISCIVIIVFKL